MRDRGRGEQLGRGRGAARPARAAAADANAVRDAIVRRAATIATFGTLVLGALGLGACGGSSESQDYQEEAPARVGGAGGTGDAGRTTAASGGDVAPQMHTDKAGSGVAGVGYPSGSIGTPGEGTLQSGDPTDAAARSTIDAVNAAEVELSTIAVQKGQHAEVKRYAQAMIAAHRQPTQDRPIEAAGTNSANDLLIPMREVHQKTVQQLQSLPAGQKFDIAFANAQVQAHQSALQIYERLETSSRDAALTDRLRALQTSVERHLADARRLQSVVQRGQAQ